MMIISSDESPKLGTKRSSKYSQNVPQHPCELFQKKMDSNKG